MIKADKVVVGAMLYDNHKHKMGNTTRSVMGEWGVEILEVIDSGVPAAPSAMVSWNGNARTRWSWLRLRKLHATPLKEREAKRKAKLTTCPVCRYFVQKRKDGTIAKHDAYGNRSGSAYSCAGTGQLAGSGTP